VRFLLASDDFTIRGHSYPGFLLLLDDTMNDLQPASSFLLDVCLRGGRAASPASWKKYGRDIYDFVGFVLANELDWKQVPNAGYLSAGGVIPGLVVE
jgi:integrase/recombinase XerD